MKSRDALWLGVAAALLVLVASKQSAAAQPQRLSLGQLRELARSVGFPNPDLAAAVAMAESGGNPGVVGDLALGLSVGLWQINLRAHPEYSQASLVDPRTNARAAFALSSGGTNWQPWSAFKNGGYRQYMPSQGVA